MMLHQMFFFSALLCPARLFCVHCLMCTTTSTLGDLKMKFNSENKNLKNDDVRCNPLSISHTRWPDNMRLILSGAGMEFFTFADNLNIKSDKLFIYTKKYILYVKMQFLLFFALFQIFHALKIIIIQKNIQPVTHINGTCDFPLLEIVA
jgi:hypothetical protein